MEAGYYRFPTIYQNTVVFVCEDDLWTVAATGGIARRLTSNLGRVSAPALSPDGSKLAFTGRDEGYPEVYVMPATGGAAQRLTYLGADTQVVGWSPDGQAIIFSSSSAQPFRNRYHLYAVHHTGGEPMQLPTGSAMSISYAPQPSGGLVIGRNTTDLAGWKRYRGGLTGDLWIDVDGAGEWQRLLHLEGNVAMPIWIGERIYFVSDHEGISNLYSTPIPKIGDAPITADEGKFCRHTHHQEYYVRHPSTDGQRIVYHAGAELYVYDPATDQTQLIPIEFHSPRVQRNRRFVDAENYLQDYSIHPQGHSVAVITRGKPFVMANWEQAVLQHGESDGVRYRLIAWLCDGRRLVMVSDAAGEETLEVHYADASAPAERLEGFDVGRPLTLVTSPKKNQVALTNHRHELILVDLDESTATVLDRSYYYKIWDVVWSPDGRWLAYSFHTSLQTSIIKLCHLETGETHPATRPVLRDVAPSFDPDGKYLYFLSYRDFDPVYDNMHFDLNFPWGMRPFLITLQADLPSPFIPVPAPPGEKSKDEEEEKLAKEEEAAAADKKLAEAETASGETTDESENSKKSKKEDKPMQIDLEGITERVLAFPVLDSRYGQIRGLGGGKVIYSSYPAEGTLSKPWYNHKAPTAEGALEIYDFEEQEDDLLIEGLTDFEVSQDGKTLIYRAGDRLRVLKAGTKIENHSPYPSRKSGWLDLSRIRLSVQPQAEWEQMYREAWRLQRDNFWTEDMSGVDWQAIFQRYLPLVERVSARSEFSDLMWEMQGELGTSHAYEIGGDYRPAPEYDQGFLGADFCYDSATDSYQIIHIVQGDVWDETASSPLGRAGIKVKVGDYLVAINGRRVSKTVSPQILLVNQAFNEVFLTIVSLPENSTLVTPDMGEEVAGVLEESPTDTDLAQEELKQAELEISGAMEEIIEGTPGELEAADLAGLEGDIIEEIIQPRTISVKTLPDETAARYREWVEDNRRYVHDSTGGRVGYVHIPDMGPRGYAEFHRGYLTEVTCEGLIVDVRFNGGGHVSQLILEKLARRRLGYDVQRWGAPTPYPEDSVLGPMVAITNEQAGSDGDIFSHAFKLMKLGPLVGKRTWGGVIGISVSDSLVDGGITTQPEFSYWFKDVGWSVENYGTVPDIEVEIRPQDYITGRDPQLERAIEEIQKMLAEHPPEVPEFGNRPKLALPKLR